MRRNQRTVQPEKKTRWRSTHPPGKKDKRLRHDLKLEIQEAIVQLNASRTWCYSCENDHQDLSRVRLATRSGDLGCLKTLLEVGRVDPNQVVDKHETTLLLDAVLYGQATSTKLLLKKGADPSLGDDKPLNAAARHGRKECMQHLLRLGRANPNTANAFGLTPIQEASFNLHEACVKTLLQYGARSQGMFHFTAALTPELQSRVRSIVRLLRADWKMAEILCSAKQLGSTRRGQSCMIHLLSIDLIRMVLTTGGYGIA